MYVALSSAIRLDMPTHDNIPCRMKDEQVDRMAVITKEHKLFLSFHKVLILCVFFKIALNIYM